MTEEPAEPLVTVEVFAEENAAEENAAEEHAAEENVTENAVEENAAEEDAVEPVAPDLFSTVEQNAAEENAVEDAMEELSNDLADAELMQGPDCIGPDGRGLFDSCYIIDCTGNCDRLQRVMVP